MTLAFSAVSRLWAIQVADRLLSQCGEAWDPLANKSVLLVANNAIASFTFSGLAYISGTRTDQWLVETISGKKFESDGPFMSTRIGGDSAPIRFGPAVRAVMTAIDSEFGAQPLSHRAEGLQVSVVAWTYRRRHSGLARPPLPFMMRMKHSGRAGEEVLCARLPHHWYRHQGDIRFMHVGAPCQPERQQITESLTGKIDENRMESILSHAILAAADRRPDTIGRDLMSIAIGRFQECRVRFIRDTDAPPTNRAYTPWILGQGWVQPPQVLEGGGVKHTVQIGSVSIVMDQIPELAKTGSWGLTGQLPKSFPE